MTSFPVLLADIGGTNTRFALWSGYKDHSPERISIYPTSRFSDIKTAIQTYISDQKQPHPSFAALCLACPIQGDQVIMTNRNLSFSIEQLKHEMAFQDLTVLNDFVAVAYALPYLNSDSLELIQQPSSFTSSQTCLTHLAVGLGTGLGAAVAYNQNQSWQVYPSEVGQAPLSIPQTYPDVIRALFKKDAILMNEQILSGPGLARLYDAVCHSQRKTPQQWDTQTIVAHAIKNQDTYCLQTTKIFSYWFGLCTGSLVATFNAWNGVYIAGGVIRKMKSTFDRSLFLQGFNLPGKLNDAFTKTPIYLITQPFSAFTGLMSQIAPQIAVS